MRLAATLSVLLFFSVPVLTEERLSSDDVGRFLAAAQEIRAVAPMPPGAVPSSYFVEAPAAKDAAARHGFSEQRWRLVARRVLTAHYVEQLVDPGTAEQRPAKAHTARASTMPMGAASGPTRHDALLASAAKDDLRALVAETEADRAAVRPYRHDIDAVIGR